MWEIPEIYDEIRRRHIPVPALKKQGPQIA